MADLQKALAAFKLMVADLDPNTECSVPETPVQGNYPVTLKRGGEEHVIQIAEKDLLAIESDEKVHQTIEDRIMSTLDDLPEVFAGKEAPAEEEDEEELEIDDETEEDEEDEDELDDDDEDEEEEVEEESEESSEP